MTIYLEKDVRDLYEHLKSYFDKLRNSEILYCSAHDLEYVKEDGCYACHDEHEDVFWSLKDIEKEESREQK